jgi:hypothetical protein
LRSRGLESRESDLAGAGFVNASDRLVFAEIDRQNGVVGAAVAEAAALVEAAEVTIVLMVQAPCGGDGV